MEHCWPTNAGLMANYQPAMKLEVNNIFLQIGPIFNIGGTLTRQTSFY
jgi:hypothetical protein